MTEDMPNAERTETVVDANLQTNDLASTETPKENDMEEGNKTEEQVQLNHEKVAENVKESGDKVNNEPETSTQKKPRKFTFKLAPQIASSQSTQEPVVDKTQLEAELEPESEKPKKIEINSGKVINGETA